MLTASCLAVPDALDFVGGPSWGGVAAFVGVVRDHAEGRHGVTAIEYEAYEEAVAARFSEIVSAARSAWPELGRIAVWHRTGLVKLAEPSVLTVVSSPHRAEALEACRYLIDAVKASVPIWKREHWRGGAEWSAVAQGIEPVASPVDVPGVGRRDTGRSVAR